MIRQFSKKILILAAGCLFLSSCIFQTSSTSVKGKVTEYGEKPVADADVSFGGAGSETVAKTGADGTFTVTARHRPTQMLRLEVKKVRIRHARENRISRLYCS